MRRGRAKSSDAPQKGRAHAHSTMQFPGWRHKTCRLARAALSLVDQIAQSAVNIQVGYKVRHPNVGKVGRMLFFCTGAVTQNFQIAFERLQYRDRWHVLDHIRLPSTLQNFQYNIETIFAF